MLAIILCTYNRDKYIYNVLKSIAENSFPHDKYEIVLVNNNSTDNTESECLRFQQDFPDIQFNYCVERNQGLSYARNRGIMESKGDILVYVDDDALVNKEYLETYASFFEKNPDISAAGGPIIPKYETEEPSWMSHYTRQLVTGKLFLGEKEREFPKSAFPGGGNAAYRKSVFDKIGLFNVELGRKGNSLIGAEEKDLFDKMTTIGIRFFYLPTAILYHIIPEKKLTQDYFLTSSMRHPNQVHSSICSKSGCISRCLSVKNRVLVNIVLFSGNLILIVVIVLAASSTWATLMSIFLSFMMRSNSL